MEKVNLVLEVRKALGETQLEFAKNVGIGLRSVRRHEAEGTLPRTAAALRSLKSLAKKAGVSFHEVSK